jgi:UDP-2-acetamido-3-amino-2,3-dideoxy-glucuronate N-acetyltransferase
VADYYNHTTAVIDPGAKVGEGTHIWHFCHIMPQAVIGENCNIGQNVFIDNNVTIGNSVKIQNNVSVYNGVILEDDVFIGPSAVFTNVINPRSFVDRKAEFRKTIIRKGATIGANATIISGIEIGEYAMIGAGSVVTKNVLSHAMITGVPGSQVGWMSRAGAKLDFSKYNSAVCSITQTKYILENNKVTALP